MLMSCLRRSPALVLHFDVRHWIVWGVFAVFDPGVFSISVTRTWVRSSFSRHRIAAPSPLGLALFSEGPVAAGGPPLWPVGCPNGKTANEFQIRQKNVCHHSFPMAAQCAPPVFFRLTEKKKPFLFPYPRRGFGTPRAPVARLFPGTLHELEFRSIFPRCSPNPRLMMSLELRFEPTKWNELLDGFLPPCFGDFF